MTILHIILEGGGNYKANKRHLRIAFDRLVYKICAPKRPGSVKIEIHPAGGQHEAISHFFKKHIENRNSPQIKTILLVDAEEPRKDDRPTKHLEIVHAARKIEFSTEHESNVYLMQITMEAWLLADHQALELYYCPETLKLIQSKCPEGTITDQFRKTQLFDILQEANSYKHGRNYDKIKDGHEILQRMNPVTASKNSNSFRDFSNGIKHLIH